MDLIGSGRGADVYALDGAKVLRRYRTPLDTLHEAAVMQHVRAHGFPAPEVDSSAGPELVMERVDGPTMLAAVAREPWRLASLARLLAELHAKLAAIPAASWMTPRFTPGDAVVHLDLHPDNVILSTRGPVVIDWTSAGIGRPGDDAAQTWAIMSSARIPVDGWRRRLLVAARQLFVQRFVTLAGRDEAVARLRDAITYRLRDRNLFDDERAALVRLAERHALGAES